MRNIRGMAVEELVQLLSQRLDAETETFSSNESFRPHGMNGRQIQVPDVSSTKVACPSGLTLSSSRPISMTGRSYTVGWQPTSGAPHVSIRPPASPRPKLATSDLPTSASRTSTGRYRFHLPAEDFRGGYSTGWTDHPQRSCVRVLGEAIDDPQMLVSDGTAVHRWAAITHVALHRAIAVVSRPQHAVDEHASS